MELSSWAALLLNADHEHADRYADGAAVIAAYGKVLGQVAGRCVVVAREEKEAMEAAEKIPAKVTFGWEKSGADYVGEWQGESAEELHRRIQEAEHRLLPEVVMDLAEGRIPWLKDPRKK